MSSSKVKTKVLRFIILPMFIFSFTFLIGCSSTSTQNTLKTIAANMDKIITDVNSIDLIETSELIIDDFMDENNLGILDDPSSENKNNSMLGYISRLTVLNNSIYDTVQINNSINSAKRQIISKAHQVKSLSEQFINEKLVISDNKLDTLEELNTSIMSNNTRASLSKNEVKNNLNLIEEIKSDYSQKTEQLSSRYEKLQSSLNTRLSYYNNIINGLDSVAYVISINGQCDNYLCEDTSSTQATEINTKNEQTQGKIKIKKNIDTYENAGTDFNGFFKGNNPSYNQDSYLYGNSYYGYNNFPNYYRGGYGLGYGGIYGNGMGYGMPFGYGYGYGFPNINSFGTYKNIDTYKPYRRVQKPNNEQSQNDIDNYDNALENDNNSNNNTQTTFNSNPKNVAPRPMPKPYIPKYEPIPEIPSDEIEKNKELENENTSNGAIEKSRLEFPKSKPNENNDKPVPLPLEDNFNNKKNDDGEDKFVNILP